MTSNCSTPRTGKSLIEMLVVIATMSVVLTITAQLLSRLARSERAVRETGVVGQAEVRFARLFRRDARQALSAALLEEEVAAIRFTHRHGFVIYKSSSDGISRSFTNAQAAPHYDNFRLGFVDVSFAIENENLAIAATTLKEETPRRNHAVSRTFQVVAEIGADLDYGITRNESSSRSVRTTENQRNQIAPAEAPKPKEEAR